MIPPQVIAAAVIAAVAFGGGWSVNGWRLTSTYNAEAVARAVAYADQVAALTTERDALAVKLSTRDNANLTNLRKAQNETNRMRDCVRDGTCGLRVAVACPDPTSPGTATNPGVDTGPSARLTGPAESAYFALRDGISIASAQLAACQDQLRLRVISH